MEEMIENLKTEFKSKNQMQFKEETKEVLSTEFLKSLQNSHVRLAESAKNLLELKINVDFPKTMLVAKSLLKRILNNFISNALKHTKNGEVKVSFNLIRNEALNSDENKNMIQLGGTLSESES